MLERINRIVSPTESDREQARMARSYQERQEARVRLENLRIRAGIKPNHENREKE